MSQKSNYPPFTCSHSPSFSALLHQLNCTLIISTYQAGKIVFISAKDPTKIVQLPRSFEKPMGIALRGNKMGIATKTAVNVLTNDPRLAAQYPRKPQTYDGFFVPRASYYTGQVDIHDLDWGTDGLWAVNTSFSCLSLIDDNYSFTPKWQPHFISKLVSEDRCHLNGLAMKDGKPAFVTALGKGDTQQSWRENITQGGILMNVTTNEIVCDSLAMPHSPRWYKNKLYILLSANGSLICLDTQTGKHETILQFNSFVRGMSIYKDIAFIGVSKMRESSKTFQKLDILQQTKNAGVLAVHLPSAKILGMLAYQNSVEEIYDIQVLPNFKRPGILNTLTEDHQLSLSIPSASFWGKPND